MSALPDEYGFPTGADFVEEGCPECGREHHVHRTTQAELDCEQCQEWSACPRWSDRQREAAADFVPPRTSTTRQVIESHTTAPYSHVVPR